MDRGRPALHLVALPPAAAAGPPPRTRRGALRDAVLTALGAQPGLSSAGVATAVAERGLRSSASSVHQALCHMRAAGLVVSTGDRTTGVRYWLPAGPTACGWCGAAGATERDEDGDPCCARCLALADPRGAA